MIKCRWFPNIYIYIRQSGLSVSSSHSASFSFLRSGSNTAVKRRHLSRKGIVLFRPRSRHSSSPYFLLFRSAFPTATLDNLAPSLLPSPRTPHRFSTRPLLHLLITPRLNDSWLPQYRIVRNISPKRIDVPDGDSCSSRSSSSISSATSIPDISFERFNMWKARAHTSGFLLVIFGPQEIPESRSSDT